MAFYGCEFSFDGTSCSEYDLELYDIGTSTEDGEFASDTKIVEDRTVYRPTPLHYGVVFNKPLKFTMTFGVNTKLLDAKRFLTRPEMSTIATWLTGHEEYKYLEIYQTDMDIIRYKCIITELSYVTYGKLPWAFKCTVTCDSPYAYLLPEKYTYAVNGNLSVIFNNPSSCKYYYPQINISVINGTSFSITNHSDNDRLFEFTNIPSSPIDISINNDSEIITNNKGLNLYDKFNYNFFRLIKGHNFLDFRGDASIVFDCEFPINIGG